MRKRMQAVSDLQPAVTVDPRDTNSPPRCPECGYVLIGLASRNCPECGSALGEDLDVYRGYQLPGIWARNRPFRLLRGIFAVLRHPTKTLAMCGDPQRVTIPRAVVFAAIVSLALVALWPALRVAGVIIACSTVQWRDAAFWRFAFGADCLGTLLESQTWFNKWIWESWSIARWWLLFWALALLLGVFAGGTTRLGARSRMAAVCCRLLLFAPWIALLEIGYLVGVWIDDPQTVPEPSTIFAVDWTHWPVRPWLIRGVLPSAAVGYLFFRAVLCWRRHAAIVAGILFAPVAIYASIAWSILYMGFRR